MPDVNQAPFLVPFRRNPHFFGRTPDLQALRAALQGDTPTGIVPAGLTGMGGIGKTQLAVEYVYRHQADYPDGIFWLNAANPLPAEFADFAGRLWGVGEQDAERAVLVRLRQTLYQHFDVAGLQVICFDMGIEREDLPTRKNLLALELVDYCRRHGLLDALQTEIERRLAPELARRRGSDSDKEPTRSEDIELAWHFLQRRPRALLVLDNLEKSDRLHQPIQRDWAPAHLPCAVLFTTRSSVLDDFTPIPLTVLPPDVALQLLLRHPLRQPILAPDHPQHKTAKKICAMLGYLPLALEVAGAHLGQKPRVKLQAYQRQLTKRGALPVLADDRLPVETLHESGLQAVLSSQWQDLPSDEARLLLRVAGQLPEASLIPAMRLGLLAGIPGEVEDFFGDVPLAEAVGQLTDASLVEKLEGDLLRLHLLVHEFAKQQTPLAQKTTFCQKCATNLVDAFEDFSTLQDQCAQRGIDMLKEDLITTLAFLAHNNHSESNTIVISRLRLLQHILRQEAHNVRDWSLVRNPVLFAQQIGYRVRGLEIDSLVTTVFAWLQNCEVTHFQPRWAARNLSLAQLHVLNGHSAKVNDVAVTVDGQHAISASDDFTLKVWGLRIGAEEHTLSGHSDSVSTVAVTNDGQRIVSASDDMTLKVWNLKTGSEEHTLSGHSDSVSTVIISTDGKRAISSAFDRTLKVWNLDTGTEEHTLSGHLGWVSVMAVTADGKRVVSASFDRTLKVWNLETGVEEHTLTGHLAWVRAVVITADGQRAISASDDMTLKVWNLNTGEEEHTLSGHLKGVSDVTVTSDGKRAISASDDMTLKVWNLSTGAEEYSLSGHSAWVISIAVTLDGQRVISSSGDKTVKVWNLNSETEESTLYGHSDRVSVVTVTADGQHAVSASDDMTLRVWQISDLHQFKGIAEYKFSGHSDWVNAIVVTADGQRIVSCSSDTTLKVWNLITGVEEHALHGHSSGVNAVIATSDGQRVISASSDRMLKVWNLNTGQTEQTLIGHTSKVNAVVVTSDSKRAISASDDTTLKVWNLTTGLEEYTLSGHSSGVSAVMVTPDGQRAVSASSDRTLKVWNLDTGQAEHTLIGHSSRVGVVVVTTDGQRAVSCSPDSTLKVWNLATGAEEHTLKGHLDWVRDVVVTMDGQYAISASSDMTLKVWNLNTGEEERTLCGHLAAINAVAVTANGQLAISASSDMLLKVWNLKTGQELASIALDGSLQCVKVATDSVTIVAGDGVGNVYCLRYVAGEAAD